MFKYLLTSLLVLSLTVCTTTSVLNKTTDQTIIDIQKTKEWADISINAGIGISEFISRLADPTFDIKSKVWLPLAKSIRQTLVPFLRRQSDIKLENIQTWFASLGIPDFIGPQIWDMITYGLPIASYTTFSGLTKDQLLILDAIADAIDYYAEKIENACKPGKTMTDIETYRKYKAMNKDELYNELKLLVSK